MSYLKLVVHNKNEKVSYETHYSEAMRIIEGNISSRLKSILRAYKSWTYDPSPIDAGVIIFDLKSKTIDARNQGGFNASNLKNFPRGWVMIEDNEYSNNDKVDYSKWRKYRTKWEKEFGK